jgi:hypothetical protein
MYAPCRFHSAFSYHLFLASQLFSRNRCFLSWGKHRADEGFDKIDEEKTGYEKEERLEDPPSHGLSIVRCVPGFCNVLHMLHVLHP